MLVEKYNSRPNSFKQEKQYERNLPTMKRKIAEEVEQPQMAHPDGLELVIAPSIVYRVLRLAVPWV
jgi:hypothetical protein